MFYTRVKSDSVGRRLDAGFYNPEYIAAQNAIERFPLRTMESLRADGAPIGYGVVKPRFQESSVRMVRIQDFNDPFVDLDTSASIDPLQMTEFKRSACQPGDLLVAIGGYPGRVGLLPPLPGGTTAVNINQHVVRIRFAPGVERYFITAFLMSSTGRRILARQVSGSVQAGINVEDFRLVAVPFLDADAQRYIGQKVRQAERLRERASQLDTLTFFAFETLTHSLPNPQSAFRVPSLEVEPYRLNPNHFDPVVRAAIHGAKAIVRLHPLSDLVVDGDIAGGATPLGAQYVTDGIFFARVQNVKPLRLDRSDAAFITADQDRQILRSRCRTDDVVLSITGYPGTASVVLDEDLPLNINQHSVRFAVRPEFGSGYVAAAINSRFGQLQVGRLAVGGTRDALDYTSVRSLLIPEFAPEVREAINKQVHTASRCLRSAQCLVVLAKLLVEHLIEGRISEVDLIAAQTALDAGDRSADREILKAFRQSDAPGAKPLIADVDVLYALLDEPEGQDP